MNERTRTALEILQASLLVGVLGNVLLRHTPWGVNAFLFVAVFVTALVMLMRRHRPELLTKNTIALAGAMVFFASMYVFRSSIELRTYDTFAILIIMGVLLLANFGIKANIAGAFHYAAGFVWSGITSAFGSFALLAADIDWQKMPSNKISRHVFAVLRGLAISLPLMLIFGGLFVAADAAFEGYVNRAINFDVEIVVSHVVLTSLLAWLTAGYLRGAMVKNFVTVATGVPFSSETNDSSEVSPVDKVVAEPAEAGATLPDNATILEHINRSDAPNTVTTDEPKKQQDWQNIDNSILPSVFTLGTVETVIILGLVDLLFLGFVIIQVPYLFGGMELVQNTPDFKLADYARRGFGELVAVAALVLPMLLVSHWLLRKESGLPEKLFRVLAGIQIALLFVIMASAVNRLLLLTGEFGYGMTVVRFYPMVFMIWLAVVFGWFAITVFRGNRKHFAWGALWSAIVVLAATNVMNPDAFIVRTNLSLMERGREFDAAYNSRLSDDAVPVLINALPAMDAGDQCWVKKELHERLNGKAATRDFREFSFPGEKAWNILNANADGLAEQTGCDGYLHDYVKEDLSD